MSFRKKAQDLYVNLILFFVSKKKGMLRDLRRALLDLKSGLERESVETKAMLKIYSRYTQGSASKEEMKAANEQFAEIVKGLGVGVLLVLPLAPITIPLVVKLGERLGVNIIPTSFRQNSKKGPRT